MMITGDTTITDATKGGVATEIQTKACRNVATRLQSLICLDGHIRAWISKRIGTNQRDQVGGLQQQ